MVSGAIQGLVSNFLMKISCVLVRVGKEVRWPQGVATLRHFRFSCLNLRSMNAGSRVGSSSRQLVQGWSEKRGDGGPLEAIVTRASCEAT